MIIRISLLLLCAQLAVAPLPAAIRLAAAIPLVFVLPGYALSLSCLARSVSGVQRTVWVLALSIAVSVLLPIAAHSVGILVTPLVWGAGLTSITLVGELAAWRQDHAGPIAPPLPRVSRWSAAALVMAVALVSVGLLVSWVDASNRSRPTATQLWMVPGGSPGELRVGVTRYEPPREPLTLVVEDGTAREEFAVGTVGDQTFETTWQMDGEVSVVRATLYAGDSPIPMREVFHRPDGTRP